MAISMDLSAVRASAFLTTAFLAGAALSMGGLRAMPCARPAVARSVAVNEKTADLNEHGDVRYVRASEAAMGKMMTAMEIIPSGDTDRDFVANMVPHHQGAIDMAVALRSTGNNEHLKRIAEEIMVAQNEEISALRLAIGESPQALAAQ